MENEGGGAGDDVDIMLDLHARTTPAAAIQFGRLLVDYNLYWYEEPCWPEHVDGLVEVARALPLPIATGERLVLRPQFREIFEKCACAVIQPDVSHCGGISEARRIAAMAETYLVSVACHNPQGPISTAASLHVGFATPNYLIQEVVRKDVPWREDAADGRVLKIRKATIPEPEHRDIYSRLRITAEVMKPIKTWQTKTTSDEKKLKL